MRTVIDLKRTRDPNSRRWERGLPVFLCGGGSRMRCFQDVVDQADLWMRENGFVSGIEKRRLPKQRDLANADIPEDLFDRLAFAYGLSFDALDIGEIFPPSEIPDIPPPRIRSWQEAFVSKEQV